MFLVLAFVAAQADLVVTIEADGPLTRTQPTALILTAENVGTVALDDVELALEVASDDAGIGVSPACDESDDGETQTAVCFVGAMQRSTEISLQLNIVPNEEGELRVTLRGSTSTIGEDVSDNAIESVFAVAPFVPPDGDDDDDGDGSCASTTGPASLIALVGLVAMRARTSKIQRFKDSKMRRAPGERPQGQALGLRVGERGLRELSASRRADRPSSKRP